MAKKIKPDRQIGIMAHINANIPNTRYWVGMNSVSIGNEEPEFMQTYVERVSEEISSGLESSKFILDKKKIKRLLKSGRIPNKNFSYKEYERQMYKFITEMEKALPILKDIADTHMSGVPKKTDIIYPSQIYIILGPGGAGKSEIIKRLKKEGLAVPLKKSLTRKLRPGENEELIRQFEDEKFNELIIKKQILVPIYYMGAQYGIYLSDFKDTAQRNKNYIIDSCDPLSTLNLRNQYQGLVKIILILPDPELVKLGLTRRLNYQGFMTLAQDVSTATLQQHRAATLERIMMTQQHNNELRVYAPYADHLIEGLVWEENYQEVKRIIEGKR